MTSSSDVNLIESLNNISVQLDRYLALIIFIVGAVGNILNCLVLSQRTLRSNTCALLFLVSAFIDLISILIGVPTRILAGWHQDPTTTISWICKSRAFIVFSTRTMATWLITLATIDRWLISSVNIHRRQMSNLKNVKREILIIVILSILTYTNMLYCYEANITDAPLKCYGKSKACRVINDLTYSCITIVTPLILMIIFGLLTISNVHHAHHRIQNKPSKSANTHRTIRELHFRKVDRHLLRMLIIQILLLTILYIPQAVEKFHITFKPFDSDSELADAIKVFLYNIEILLAFIASSIPFYVYTLAGGSIFRNAFMGLIRAVKQNITRRFQ
ncbi:unnamed protein product [Rotaria sp. Silwood1]|nr:unnamed protein product [Rotaria sp. Silwood1]CAF3435963.1 unnamed protein product [Rotaria sp. Silwood1]CAF4615819.1 unnamed protein product [Rotaria sp. Silwood1]CAF4938681.1 unnamed protein product [Rotaria sp. Silwood1]